MVLSAFWLLIMFYRRESYAQLREMVVLRRRCLPWSCC